MKKFWRWSNYKNVLNDENTLDERLLYITGVIAEESWFDDDVTPEIFREELESGGGDITVWINSYGGDCVAASRIYTMLLNYGKGSVKIIIDGIAASAASVIAMAGKDVTMSPTAMMMIHDPMTIAAGNTGEFQRAIEMLSEVKESIINAYQMKTGMPRSKLADMMEEETWMNAGKAVELGFANKIMKISPELSDLMSPASASMYSVAAVTNSLMGKIAAKCKITPKKNTVDEYLRKLNEKRFNI